MVKVLVSDHAAAMDAVMGLTGAGYTLMLADQGAARGIMRFNDESGPTKLFNLDKRKRVIKLCLRRQRRLAAQRADVAAALKAAHWKQ